MALLKYFQLKHPFTCMVTGPSSSGKTVLVRNIIKYFKYTIHINTDKLNVLWCYSISQPLFNEEISSNVNVTYYKGLPNLNNILYYKPHIVVIDDLMSQIGNDPQISDLFTKGSHHYNISVIFITQNLFHKGKEMRNVSLNTHYYFIMKNPRDEKQIKVFASQAFPNRTDFFMKAYKMATKHPHGYIKIDFTQDTPDIYRVSSHFLPEENNPYPYLYYVEKSPELFK